ncbi:MAG: hypothetical protein FWD94_02990, partial [Treponema sp.]|nr:hypothetical protein [Treponema sp.]
MRRSILSPIFLGILMCLVSPASCDRMGGVGLVEVSFDGGGAKGMLPPNQIVVIGSFITVPGDYGLIPPEGGFLYFTGWKDENGALYREGIKLKPLTNMTLTAQWGDDLGWRYAGFSPEGSGTGKISIEFDGIVGTLEKSDIKFIPSLVDVVGLKWAEPRKWDLDVVVNKPDSPYFNMSIEKPGIDPEITVFVDATTGSTSLAGVAAVSAGANHSLAVRSDGSLWSWGGNENGQLGNGSTGTNNAKPERVGTDTDWKRVSAGGGFSLAIRQDGSLWAWGNRANGRLGTGSAVGTQPVPERVGSDGDWYSVSAGSDHVLAVKNDGSLWTWGGNGSGQLGNGSTGDVSAPRAIQGTWKEASAGDGFSLAIRQDGGLWAWGNGENGRLGTGASGGTQPVPERVGS